MMDGPQAVQLFKLGTIDTQTVLDAVNDSALEQAKAEAIALMREKGVTASDVKAITETPTSPWDEPAIFAALEALMQQYMVAPHGRGPGMGAEALMELASERMDVATKGTIAALEAEVERLKAETSKQSKWSRFVDWLRYL